MVCDSQGPGVDATPGIRRSDTIRITSTQNGTRRCASLNDDVRQGFQGSADTVLTQYCRSVTRLLSIPLRPSYSVSFCAIRSNRYAISGPPSPSNASCPMSNANVIGLRSFL